MIDKAYVKALRRLEETYHVRFPCVAYTDLSNDQWFPKAGVQPSERYKCSSDSTNFGWNYGNPTLVHSVGDKVWLYQDEKPVYVGDNPGVPDGLCTPVAILDSFGNTLSQIHTETVIFVECSGRRFRMDKFEGVSDDLVDCFREDYEIFFSDPEKEVLYADMMTLPRRMYATLRFENNEPVPTSKTTLVGLYQDMENFPGSSVVLESDSGGILVWVWKFGDCDFLGDEYYLVYQDTWNDPFMITDSDRLRSCDGVFSSIFR
jgi:hypothetical protein